MQQELPLKFGIQTADEYPMEERRNQARLLCAELVEISWQDGDHRTQRRVANLEDISLRGICLHIEKPIPEGTELLVRHDRGQLKGYVRYCKFREMGYFLGVEFDDGCCWSTEDFQPEHLLDPRTIQ
jgi:PilZ domain